MRKITARLLSLMMAMALLFSSIPAVSALGKVSDWAKEEISAMEDLDLIPDSLADADLTKNITRLDMCRIAVVAYEQLTGTTIPQPYEHPFSDTQDPDVEKAHQAKLVNGREPGKFYPDETLTRSEFFAFVSQFLTAVGYPISESDYADLSRFDDVDELPQWVEKPARITVGLGIVQGTGTSLNWSGKTTAEQALVMFYRTYNIAITSELDPPEVEKPQKPFDNLASWAEETVMEMNELGLVPKSVKYSDMTGPITRGDMCQIAVLSYCELTGNSLESLGSPKSPFSDTSDRYITLAHKLGIVNGYDDGTFKPGNPMTRQEYFKISVNFLNAVDYPATDDSSVNLSQFKDGSKVADYAKPCARLLVGLGIVKGDNNKKLNPTANIICQEALVIFMRIIDFMNSDPVLPDNTEPEVPETTEPTTTPTAPSSPTEPEATHPDLNKAHAIVEKAMEYLGYPYVYGGTSPTTGFDCSGFTYFVYKQFGYTIPRRSTDQWNISDVTISKDQLMPGDLVLFSEPNASGALLPSNIFHVGLYIEDGKFIHAANSRRGVIISSLTERYYAQLFIGGKRVIK